MGSRRGTTHTHSPSNATDRVEEIVGQARNKRPRRDVDEVVNRRGGAVDHATDNPSVPHNTGPTPSSSSTVPVVPHPDPRFGYWKDGQLQVTTDWEAFLALIPLDGESTYFRLIKGVRGEPSSAQLIVYTRRRLQEVWGREDSRPLIIIGMRSLEEVVRACLGYAVSALAQNTVDVSETRGSSSQILGKRRRDDNDDMQRKHEKESRIDKVDQMINKTNMTRCYRLEGSYKAAIPKPLEGTCYLPEIEDRVAIKLYWEKDIELLAWRMNNGPEGFLKFLYEKYKLWHAKPKKRKNETTFPVPSSYEEEFTELWEQENPGEELDALIEFVDPLETAEINTSSSSSTDASAKKGKSGQPLRRRPPLPPSQRRRGTVATGPSLSSSM